MRPHLRLAWVACALAWACAPAGPRRAASEPPDRAAASPGAGTSGAPAPGARSPVEAEAPADRGEREMARLVNEHRRTVGCRALEWDARLAEVARAHSARMRAEGFFEHVDPDGRDAFKRVQRAGITGWRMVAENIALSSRPPQGVLGLWLASPGHRANLENCDLTRHGIGRVEGFWTHVFTG